VIVAFDGQFKTIDRQIGQAMLYNHDTVMGVSKLESGTRYELFIYSN
jgi:hypothetical protein